MLALLCDTIARNNFGSAAAKMSSSLATAGATSILHRATNVKPIMFRVTATGETVIGDRVIRSIVNAAGNAFLARINVVVVESSLLTSVARVADEGGRFTQGMTFDVARDRCTACRLLLNAISRATSSIYGFITFSSVNKGFSRIVSRSRCYNHLNIFGLISPLAFTNLLA